MTIYKSIQLDLERYTFIKKVEMVRSYVYLTYQVEEVEKTVRIAYRATPKQLINLVEKIKEEIGYESTKLERDILVRKELKKPMMFANIGEDNE